MAFLAPLAPPSPPAPSSGLSQTYADLDATALAEAVRSRAVSPRELVDAAIAAIERVDGTLHALVHPMFEKARAQANDPARLPGGPFHGVPFVVKDLDGAVAGEPYTMSSRHLASYVPARDSEIIARIRRTGVVLVGKTNTP
ncbi:MAG: hypothetical protein JOZ69_01230, partial [Myxococcales bacterium]|nr:hypothetical protein [Myxococcales bacterium]